MEVTRGIRILAAKLQDGCESGDAPGSAAEADEAGSSRRGIFVRV